MQKLLIATKNPSKLIEISSILKDIDAKFISLDELNIEQKATEDADTLEKNAKNKASFYARLSGLAALADDTGLEIDALDGRPGPFPRRWKKNEHEKTDEELINIALKELQGVPLKKRGAQFVTIAALSDPNGKILGTGKGTIQGTIALTASPKRLDGMPFDSLFIIKELNKLYIDIKLEDRAQTKKHRAHAFQKIIPTIKGYLQNNA